jgi:hypothetical protein
VKNLRLQLSAEDTASHYRMRATETARLAEAASTPEDLQTYLRMTDCWIRLAEQAELRQELVVD